MKDGFIKVAAITPDIRVGDTKFNTKSIIKNIMAVYEKGVKLAVFPELCITGYTCGDLFLQDTLLQGALDGLAEICTFSGNNNIDMVIVVGLPLMNNSRLYNTAAVIHDGSLLGIVPKQNIPNYSEFYEARHFTAAPSKTEVIRVPGLDAYCDGVVFGSKHLFKALNMPGFVLGIDICEDLWMPVPPSCYHAMASATIIANLSASDETTGKNIYRRELVGSQAARLVCAYIYADAGEGESSTDLVFSGHNIIAENGTILTETERFTNQAAITEIDLGRLASERRRMTTFDIKTPYEADYTVTSFKFCHITETALTRKYPRTPFVPGNKSDMEQHCNEILNIQAMGLKKRLAHTNCQNAVVGISGGLDSTLALLVTVKSFDMLGLGRSGIQAVTMPCFGTTGRTYNNSCSLAKKLGVTLKEVPVHEAVSLHFRDIGHDANVHDVTYENAQARQRTLILMDIANQSGGMVVGTGDMSELALGWATYNGDHMSMYGVNSSVPKTLVRYLVLYYAETCNDNELKDILMDVLIHL